MIRAFVGPSGNPQEYTRQWVLSEPNIPILQYKGKVPMLGIIGQWILEVEVLNWGWRVQPLHIGDCIIHVVVRRKAD